MLDTTNEINDMKVELQNSKYYGYEGDGDYTAALTHFVEVAMDEDIKPIIGKTGYDLIAAVGDKDLMTDQQKYVYKAEVYFSIAEFIKFRDIQEKEKRRGQIEARSEGGVSYSMTSGFSGKDAVFAHYMNKARFYLGRAGYSTRMKVIARQSIHV